MTKISREQIEEILDEVGFIQIRKHPDEEGMFIVATYKTHTPIGHIMDRLDTMVGPDIGELVNELHARL